MHRLETSETSHHVAILELWGIPGSAFNSGSQPLQLAVCCTAIALGEDADCLPRFALLLPSLTGTSGQNQVKSGRVPHCRRSSFAYHHHHAVLHSKAVGTQQEREKPSECQMPSSKMYRLLPMGVVCVYCRKPIL